MRLLHVSNLTFSEYINPDEIPPYIAASHRWLDEEVTYQEFLSPGAIHGNNKKAGMIKILNFCKTIRNWSQTFPDGELPLYLWIDTCCINKESSAELQEAITSMFQWYARAWCCLAYLYDIDTGGVNSAVPYSKLASSVWFTRGWTLQELLAPETVIFLNKFWEPFGHKGCEAGLKTLRTNQRVVPRRALFKYLNDEISSITGIETSVLRDYSNVKDISFRDRLAWMNNRATTRPEDRAYCMLGICEIFMTLNYGEGNNAMKRMVRKAEKNSPRCAEG